MDQARKSPLDLLGHPVVRGLALALFIVVFAIFAGTQIESPDKRVIQVLAAGLLVFLAFRIDSVSAMAIATIFLPFPKATSYGNTNVAFTLLIFIVWIFRVTTGRLPKPRRIPAMAPIGLLVISYLISFYNVEHGHIAVAWAKFLAFLSYLLLAYMVVSVTRTEADVKKIIFAQLVSCVMVCLFGVYELAHPGTVVIPGWIDFTETLSVGTRIGSTFLDYELFGEYCAMNLILQTFLWTRATSKSRKFAMTLIMTLTAFCLFATVTRGAMLTMTVGIVYLSWMSRTKLNFQKFVIGTAVLICLFFAGDFVVSSFSSSGSVLNRLERTEFVGGVPDSRVGAWAYATKYIAEHPLIGHGPYYSIEKGLEQRWWPHNLYLYTASIVGVIGLSFYLWYLWELWKVSKPRAPSLGSGSFLQGARLAFRVMLVQFMIDQTKIEYLRNERYSFFVWFFFGLFVAVCTVAENEWRMGAAASGGPPLEVVRPKVARIPVAPRAAVSR